MKLRLAQVAHARSGDKANRADIGLFAWDAAGHALLERLVTPQKVAAHFAHLLPPGFDEAQRKACVHRYELPRLLALKFVIDEALAGGAASSLRSDNLGKTIAAQLLRMEIDCEPEEALQVLAGVPKA